MNLYRLRQENPPVKELIKEHGEKAVIDELDEMIYHDLADLALAAAIQIGPSAKSTARSAAQVVVNSGSYSEKAKEQAKRFLATP